MSGSWGIWCHVTGGVTGNREAWLKVNGEPVVYGNEEQAREAAARERETARRFSGGARYNYTAQRYT